MADKQITFKIAVDDMVQELFIQTQLEYQLIPRAEISIADAQPDNEKGGAA